MELMRESSQLTIHLLHREYSGGCQAMTGCCPNPHDASAGMPMSDLFVRRPMADEAFSEMPGGRALYSLRLTTAKSPTSLGPRFHGLSMGEVPGPGRSRGEQREGAELPLRLQLQGDFRAF